MKKATITAGSLILMTALTLTACGAKTTAQTTTNDDTTVAIETLEKDVRGLFENKLYELPSKHVTEAKVAAASKQYKKVYKLRGDLTKSQKRTLKLSKNRIAAIKHVIAIQASIKTALGDKQVITDAKYDNTTLSTQYAAVAKALPKYAKTIKADVDLIDAEVKAVKTVTAATTGDPDQQKIDAATTAIKAVNVKAFADYWLPKLPKVAADGTVTKTDGTVAEVKNPTPAQQAQAAAKKNTSTGTTASSGSQTATRTTGRTTTSSTTNSRPAASSSHGTTNRPSTGGSTGSGTATKPQPAKKPHAPEAGWNVSNGVYSTMQAAMAAMNKALDRELDAGRARIAHAYSVPYQDGTVMYSWEFTD